MKDWFAGLEAREQLFVGSGAVIVCLSLIYGLLWVPFDNKHAALRTEVSDWQSATTTLRPLQPLTTGSRTTANVASANQSPIIIVDQTLRSRGLDRYRQRSQPSGSNGIRVEFEDVAFDDLILWLGDLSNGYNMHVQAGSFSSGTRQANGRINASLTIERSQ